MKRAVFLVLTFILAEIVSAGTIRVTAEDAGSQRLRISYDLTEGNVGPLYIRFEIGLSNGATVNGADDVLSVDSQFPVYLDDDFAFEDYPYGEVLTISSSISVSLAFFIPYTAKPEDHLSDLNTDGFVDMDDVAIISAAWQSTSSSPNWNPRCDIFPVYGDDIVDILDYAFLATSGGGALPPISVDNLLTFQLNRGRADITTVTLHGAEIYDADFAQLMTVEYVGTQVVVPEPATILLLGLGGLTLLRKRKS